MCIFSVLCMLLFMQASTWLRMVGWTCWIFLFSYRKMSTSVREMTLSRGLVLAEVTADCGVSVGLHANFCQRWKITQCLSELDLNGTACLFRPKSGLWGCSLELLCDTAGCLQLLELLEILEISWNLKLFLEVLEISWNLVNAAGKFYN